MSVYLTNVSEEQTQGISVVKFFMFSSRY